MNKRTHLYPPLDVIEERLFGSAAEVASAQPVVPVEQVNDEVINMPPWLSGAILNAVAQQSQPLPPQPAAGQLWSVAYRGNHRGQAITGRIPVLLDAGQEDGGWSGWVVSSDNEYASWSDVIIDPVAQGINPVASLVQTWNPVQVRVDSAALFLGQIDENCLRMVKAVATELRPAHPPKGLASKIMAREVAGAGLVVTGDHLGDADDSRWAYRRFYAEIAQCLDTPFDCENTSRG